MAADPKPQRFEHIDDYEPAWLLDRYRAMVRIRAIEEMIATRYADQEMRCPVHLSIGQEATAVGVCAALDDRDQISTTHRNHAHYLAKGGYLEAMLGEIYGKATGCCGGRGGSMHLYDETAGVLASVPIVSSSIPLGVGAALAFQQQGKPHVGVSFLGDGSLEEGVFHESANFAALKKLPVVFVIENNLYAVYTGLQSRQPDRPLTDLAAAHGIRSCHCDGNDVLAVYEAMQGAVSRARDGRGPSFIVADTYRWREHCGPNYDNDIGYRTPDEFVRWQNLCPVARFADALRARGILDAERQSRMDLEIAAEIEQAMTAARDAPFPSPKDLGSSLYA